MALCKLKNVSPLMAKKHITKGNLRHAGGRAYSLFRLVLLLAIGFVILYPLLYMITTSLRSKASFMNSVRVWLPEKIDPAVNYKVALDVMNYKEGLLATVKYEIVSAVLEIVACAIAAYGFARFNFPFKKVFMGMLFLTILIPDTMIIIPRVTNNAQLDFLGILALINKLTGIDLRPSILDTGWSFYLPSLFGAGLRSGILIFIYMQFFKSLPAELEEAAWIDGAGPIRTFISIAIPSSGVVILTVSVFSLIWHWNDYFLSSMYLTEDYPLAVWLTMMPKLLPSRGYSLVPSQPQSMAILMAGCVLFIVPMLIIYIIVQRWFIESIDRVGITG